MKDIKIIVGLGNSLKSLQNTRHNVGVWCIKYLSKKYNFLIKKNKKFFGYLGTTILNKKKLFFFIPDNYMNLNGRSISLLSNFYKVSSEEILIIRDDLDINPGFFSIQYSKKHNGHNGMKNVLSYFSNFSIFLQVCIGIGRPMHKSDVVSFVLDIPTCKEKMLINKSIKMFFSNFSDIISNKVVISNKKIVF